MKVLEPFWYQSMNFNTVISVDTYCVHLAVKDLRSTKQNLQQIYCLRVLF